MSFLSCCSPFCFGLWLLYWPGTCEVTCAGWPSRPRDLPSSTSPVLVLYLTPLVLLFLYGSKDQIQGSCALTESFCSPTLFLKHGLMVLQPSLELVIKPRLVSNSWFPCLGSPDYRCVSSQSRTHLGFISEEIVF